MIYSLLTALLSLPAAAVLATTPRGRKKITQRFGKWGEVPTGAIWLHGASVGEIQGIIPLIKQLKKLSKKPILVTATSVTGLERVAGLVDAALLLPFDTSLILTPLVKRLRPSVFIFTETELWPGLLEVLEESKVPRIMINARLTEKAYRTYGWFSFLFRDALQKLNYLGASEAQSLERFISLGAPTDRTAVLGNTKYDLDIQALSQESQDTLRASLGLDESPTIVLGSLRPGEENIWFEALKRAVELKPVPLLFNCIIVPRHLEKLSYFKQRLKDFNLEYRLRSEQAKNCNLVLLDTMGELIPLYQIADAAFIGATLVENLGGHNPLEAAIFGTPIILGPYGEVITEIRTTLQQSSGLLPVTDADSAFELLKKLSAKDQSLVKIGLKGKEVALSFQGATQKVVQAIARYL